MIYLSLRAADKKKVVGHCCNFGKPNFFYWTASVGAGFAHFQKV